MYTRKFRNNAKASTDNLDAIVAENKKPESKKVEGRKPDRKSTERKTPARRNPRPTSKLKVIPLGGLHEVGKNITAFEYEDEILIVDCGVAFPEEDDMLGIDLVIPDFSYLVKNKDKILGVVITHGHEDHIGSLPYFLKEINVPIYGTKLTIGLIETKLKEHNILSSVERHNVNAGETIKLGKNFKVEFIRSTHSIADSVALAITTPVGVVVHTGDFKIDFTPIQGNMIDLQRWGAELGKKGSLSLCVKVQMSKDQVTL